MANDSKKYISLTRLSNFLDNIREKYSQIGHKHTTADLTDYTPISVDSSLSSTSTNPVQNKVIDAEFEAISQAMGALDLAIDGKADIVHNHDDKYDVTGAASTALASAKTYTDTALQTAKSYTDTKVNGLASTNYVDTAIENIAAITTAEIDAVCGASIYAASEVEV